MCKTFHLLRNALTRSTLSLQSAVGAVLDPTSAEKMEKSVFMVFFAGENARAKILKVHLPIL